MFRDFFDYRHMLTPIAVLRLQRGTGTGIIEYRVLYIFGLRVAYWTT